MKSEQSFWQRIGLHDWFLKEEDQQKAPVTPGLTPDEIYHYILEKFRDSLKELSFADRVVFYHEYIICFNTQDYREFTEAKKGLFGLIAHESVKEFHKILDEHRKKGKNVMPSSNKWVFRFVSHPEYSRGDKGFIGKLLPDTSIQTQDNLRVTYIPRQTGVAQTLDVNEHLLKGFNYYSEGYYEIPYAENAPKSGQQNFAGSSSQTQAGSTASARLETILPDKAYTGKKLEYLIREEEITVSGSDDAQNKAATFRIPSDWVNTPHLKIRYNRNDGKFYLASFGEKTIVNEREVGRSETSSPQWVELPLNSHIVLNGIVGINIFKA
jgi:hypothetical protein